MRSYIQLFRSPFGKLSVVTSLLLLGAVLLPIMIGKTSSLETIRGNGERLQFYEARLSLAVVELRHGISSNYDAANQWGANIRKVEAETTIDAHIDPMIWKLWEDYLAASDASLQQLERFKLTNALVRNSLRNFLAGVHDFSLSLPNKEAISPVRQDMARLSNALLVQALGEQQGLEDQTPTLITSIESHLTVVPHELRSELERLLTHAKVINRYSSE
jgi:hypothetical protein